MEKIDWLKLGDLIKTKRKEKGFNQAEVASMIGASQPIISLIEKGSPVGLTEDRQDALLTLLDIAEEEIPQTQTTQPKTGRTNIFISYSHKDKQYMDRLSIHLKPLEKKGLLDVWVDTKILAGAKWKEEIRNALSRTQAAILLVSADFLASDFIVDNELPPLLEKAKEDGSTIIPVILKPCRFVREKTLSQFQAINSPAEPVSGMDEHGKELIYDAITQRIEDLLPTE